MRKVKYPSTQIALKWFGARSPHYKRIKALEKWAIDHGYGGYKAINRKRKEDKIRQTEMRLWASTDKE